MNAGKNNRSVEKAVSCRHLKQCADLSAAAGLSEDGNIVRVASKLCNIIADPFQRRYDVCHADIAGICKFIISVSGYIQKAQDVQPVI